MSLITACILLFFTLFQMQHLQYVHDFNVLQIEYDNYFDFDEDFSHEDNKFMLAAGLSEFDQGLGFTEDPAYGQIKIMTKSWQSGQSGINFDELQTDACNVRKDFAFESELIESLFFPVASSKSFELSRYGHRLKCLLQPSSLQLQGNFQSASATNIMVIFEMCKNETESGLPCKSEREIKDWMRGKYIFVLSNQRSFV